MNERNVQLDGQPPFGTLRLPSPVDSTHLRINITASQAAGEITAAPFALEHFQQKLQTFALVKMRQDNGLEHFPDPARSKNALGGKEGTNRSLADLIVEARLPHVDVLKRDIEGVEFPAVEAFFASAPQRLWPRMIILEVGKNNTTTEAYTHCIEHGYTQIRRTQLNAILHRQSDRMPQFDEKNR